MSFRIKFSKEMVRQLGRPPTKSFPTRTATETYGLGKYGSGSFLLNPQLSRDKAGWYVEEVKGKGWHESPGADGKAPIHKKVAERAQAKHAQNTPMKKPIKKAHERNKWIASTLLNDETSTGTQMVEYFISNGLSREDAEFYVSQRSHALRDPLGFRLKLKTEHRKLTEKERDRMIDMWASAPLGYKPEIDDELIKLGLAQFWDNMPDAVENTDMPFYADNGSILPEWYDFKAERARYDADRASKTKTKETKQKDIVFLNYDTMEFIKAIEAEEGINLNSKQRTDLYNYATDGRWKDDLEAYQFAIIIRLWAEGKWHPDWHPKNLRNCGGKKETPTQVQFSPPYRVDVWEERDRLIITVYDKNDKEVASWVDDDARQMFEDGFFDSKDLEQSVLEYLKSKEVIK